MMTASTIKEKAEQLVAQGDHTFDFMGYQKNDLTDPSVLLVLAEYPKIDTLLFGWTDFDDECLAVISTFTYLKELNLAGTKITNAGLVYLSKLTKLQHLILKENPQLTDIALPFFSPLQALVTLHLEATSITIEGLKQFDGLEKLELLILGEEMIVGKENEKYLRSILEDLSRRWPKCEIIIKGYETVSNGEWF